MANKPVKKIKIGQVSCPIWANEREVNGEKRTIYNISSPEKSYQDKDGNWKTTSSFNAHEAMQASRALEEAWLWISCTDKRQTEPEVKEETVK